MRKYVVIVIENISRKAPPKYSGSGGRFFGLAQDIGGRVVWAAGCSICQVGILFLSLGLIKYSNWYLDKKSLSPRLLASNMHPQDFCEELLSLIALRKEADLSHMHITQAQTSEFFHPLNQTFSKIRVLALGDLYAGCAGCEKGCRKKRL